MLAVDTNVLVRLLVGDDARQRRQALTRLEQVLAAGDAVTVSVVVLAELAWVLAGAYAYTRNQITVALRALIDTPPFVVSERAAVVSALASFEKGNADFADYLILQLGRAEGASALLTFDKRFLKSPGCELP